MPGAERAVVDMAKVRNYLLSPEHPVGSAKARFFAQLGFDRTRWTALRDQLIGLALEDATPAERSTFGQKFVVRGMIRGPRGRSAAVLAIWIVRAGEDFPRLVTAYPEDQ
jgi:hypothetical protein